MKINCLLLAGVLGLTGALSGCGGQGGEAKAQISVYNWGDYLDEELLDEFYEETGIKVNYDTYATNEDMYTKIKSGGVSYDVAIPSDYMIEKMIKEDMLEKVSLDKIPNYENISDRFKGISYDPGNEYSVPYMWGTLGILYNTTMVDEPVDSWDILWDEKYEGQIFMYESQRDSIGAALKKLGYSLNTHDVAELNAARDELIRQKPLVAAYVGDNVKDKMIGDEGALALVYSGDAIYCMEENPDLAYAVPKEGSNAWFDAMVILKGAKNKEGAEAFIDFLCRPDVALKNTEYIGYSTVNEKTWEQMPEEKRNDPVYWTPDDIFYSSEVFSDLGETIKEYDRVWTEVLAHN